jgi:putative ABC transport system permease protein
VTYVTPGYFETLRLPVRRGRSLAERDAKGASPAVVINDSFARRYFPAEAEVVGQHIKVAGEVREIVGIADNVQQKGGFNGYGPIDALPSVYVPFAQFPGGGLRLYHGWFAPAWIVRTASAGVVNEAAIRRVMAEVDPQLPLSAVRSVDVVRSAALARQRVLMLLVGMLGVTALLLAAIGIHGLIASGVTERTREFGIRMALGATAGQTVRTAALPGIALAAVGLVAGCGVAVGVSGLLRSLLWGVKANDPVTFAGVIVALLLVAVAASVFPALRVRRLDPVALLRSE